MQHKMLDVHGGNGNRNCLYLGGNVTSFHQQIIFRNSEEEEYTYENFTILLPFFFSPTRRFFQNMLQKSPLSLHVVYVCMWEKEKKEK